MQSVNVYGSGQTQVYNYEHGDGAGQAPHSPTAASRPLGYQPGATAVGSGRADDGDEYLGRAQPQQSYAGRFTQLSNQINTVSNAVNQQSLQLGQVLGKTDNSLAILNSVKSEQTAIRNNVDAANKKTDDLSTTVSGIGDGVNYLRQDVGTLNKEVLEQKDRITSVGNLYNGMAKTLDSIEAQTGTLIRMHTPIRN